MSQAGFTPISIYYSATASAVPLAANLVAGELALNTNDGKLYYKNASNVVTLLAGATSGPAGGSNTQVQFNSSGVLAGSANMTFNGTILTAAGFSGPLNGTVGATTPAAGSFTSLDYSTTLTGGTGIVNLGSGQFYKDASGNVGIGTSSPVDLLTVNRAGGSGITSGISLTTAAGAVGDGSYIKWTGATAGEKIARIDGVMEGTDTGSIRFNTGNGADGFAERMRIDSSGNVGIGTSSPTTKLQVAAAANTGVLVSSTDGTTFKGIAFNTNDNQFTVGTQTNHPLAFFTNNAERARIDTSGNLLVGTTSATGIGLTIGNQAANSGVPYLIFNKSLSGTVIVQYFNFNGGGVGSIQCTDTSTSYVTSSDYRLKENIAPMTGALDKVAQLKPVTYKWKSNGFDGEGFIAHELAEVCPEAVAGVKDAVDADGNIISQGIDTSFLVATLTAAIQEQQALITSLTARITALEST